MCLVAIQMHRLMSKHYYLLYCCCCIKSEFYYIGVSSCSGKFGADAVDPSTSTYCCVSLATMVTRTRHNITYIVYLVFHLYSCTVKWSWLSVCCFFRNEVGKMNIPAACS
jgi:hypothetical protein